MRIMSGTSTETYKKIIPKLSGKRALVLDALSELGAANNSQIARHLGWDINRVTGRVTELRKFGKVELAYKGEHHGHTVKFWRVTPPEEQFQASLWDEREGCL